MNIIRSRGSHPVLSLNHLARLTGCSGTYLRRIVQRTYDPYADISRPKRSGGRRHISAPEPVLAGVQRWILDNALGHVGFHSSSFAYRKGVSIVDCAHQHVGVRWMVKFDLQNYFGSIDEISVFKIFREGGYNNLVALELARLCTRMLPGFPQHPLGSIRERYSAIPAYAAGKHGVLPQGAPTSGALANTATRKLDDQLSAIAANSELVYTRYSDDLTFSTGGNWNRAHSSALTRAVEKAVVNAGFKINAKKTRVVPPGARHIVLGLLVDDESVRLLPEFRRRLSGHVRGVEKFTLQAHARSRNFRSLLSFVRFIDGHIAFAHGVDPLWALTIRARWNLALEASGYPIFARTWSSE
ncbi:reverse transcriptase family protein [Pseudarthrobacter niigatensis]|nr:reverse transcriptase family protein [Pseudarthrobacter niigatensis]